MMMSFKYKSDYNTNSSSRLIIELNNLWSMINGTNYIHFQNYFNNNLFSSASE